MEMELKVDRWHDVKTEGLPTKEWEWCFFYYLIKGEPSWSVGAYFPEKEHFYVNFGLGGAIVDAKNVVAWAYFDEASFTRKSEDPIAPEKKTSRKSKPEVEEPKRVSRRRKRNPAKINPVRLVEISEERLWEELKELNIEELKDVISEFGMDSKKTAMSLKSRDRLETIIVDAAKRISTRGNAFWNSR